jgi:outer membrane protein OmpA-like peptidoglycan-associated protein/opacity protein-like surface antigen
MRNRILMSALALALCVPTLARAQYRPVVEANREGSWEFSLGGGISTVDGAMRSYLASGAPEYRFATSPVGLITPTIQGRIGYNFSPFFGLSGGLSAAAAAGVTFLTESAAATYTFDLNKKTAPFVLVGAELTRIDGANARTTHSTWGLMAGVGVRHMLSRSLALRLEGRMGLEGYQEMATQNAFTSVITLGFSYFVGGKRPAAPMAAAPACRPCSLARVDTVMRFRRDTLVQARVDTVRVVRVDTVVIEQPSADQLVLRVQFVTDSTRLLRRTLPELDTIAKALAAMPDAHWEVQGHTDNVGTPEHNMILSRGRAESVVEYLVRHGVDRGHLMAVGFGQNRPVVSNATVEGRAQNRRVQLRRRPEGPPPGRPVP